MIILSVLMPTIPQRVEQFTALYNELMSQVTYMHTVHPSLGQIEVLIDSRDRFLDGGPSIGTKRDALLQRATGKYLNFLDDDESIAPNYLETLVRLCSKDKDVCTFRNLTKTDGYWTIIDMGLHFADEEATPDRITRRSFWHICPIRSTYAKTARFPDTNYGEDAAWIAKVRKFVRSEAKSDAVIHCYQHSSVKSEADRIIKQQSNGIFTVE